MKLITEASFRDYEIIKESTSVGPKTIKIKGVYAQADRRNGNERIYSWDLLKPEIDRFRTEFIDAGRALGELEHPDRVEIAPDQACVRITALEENEKDKNWIGESIVLASYPEFGIKGTPKGDIVLGLLNYGTKFGFSTRGVGEINESTNEVTEYHLCTIDLVTNPSIGEFCDSNGNRCINGILESKDFMINTHGKICERAYDKFEKSLKTLPVKRNEKEVKLANAVYSFFNSLI